MTILQVQVSMPYFTGVPEDVATNVWHFVWAVGLPAPADWTNLNADLSFFYNSVYNNPGGPMLASYVDGANVRMKGYDLADAKPRAPKYSALLASLNANRATGSANPPEAAICLSFQGSQVSGTSQARRRGRIFIPAISFFDAGTTTSFPNVGAATRTDIAGAASTLKTSVAGHGFIWSVYSRVDADAVVVTNGWIDNAQDTQRRRGNKATARTTWT
jgi:hypothetical protein